MYSIGQKKTLPRVILGKKATCCGSSLGVKRPAVMPHSGDGGVSKHDKSPLEK